MPEQRALDPRTKTRPKVERPRMHKVILVNDDFTPREFGVGVLKQVFGMGPERAYGVMMTAHQKGVCVVAVYTRDIAETKAALATEPRFIVVLLANICMSFLLTIVIIATVIGGIDALWQHFEHLRKNRMSRKEIMDETKNAEGDPHMKQERRQHALDDEKSRDLVDDDLRHVARRAVGPRIDRGEAR